MFIIRLAAEALSVTNSEFSEATGKSKMTDAKKESLLPERWNRPRKRANTFPTVDDCGPQKRQKGNFSLLYSILVGEEDANSVRLRSRLFPKNASTMGTYGASVSGPNAASNVTTNAKTSVGNRTMPQRTRVTPRTDVKPTATRGMLFPHSRSTKPLGRLSPFWSFGAGCENTRGPITNESFPVVDDPFFAFQWILTVLWGRLLANCALPAMSTEYSSSWESSLTGAANDEPLDLSCPVIRQNEKRGTDPTPDSRIDNDNFSETVIRNGEVCYFRRGRAPNHSRGVELSANGTAGPPILMKRCSSFESGDGSRTSLRHSEEVLHSLSDIMPALPASRVLSAGGGLLSTKGAICRDPNRLRSDAAEPNLGSHLTTPSISSKMVTESFALPFVSPTFFNGALKSPRPTFNLSDTAGLHHNSGTVYRGQNNLSQDFGGVWSPSTGFEKDSCLSAMFSHLMMVNR
ncbi:hypothetical protein SprV_0100230300 [Sparganum proliferum]